MVEKLLATEGTSRTELGREAFTERVWEWKVSVSNPLVTCDMCCNAVPRQCSQALLRQRRKRTQRHQCTVMRQLRTVG